MKQFIEHTFLTCLILVAVSCHVKNSKQIPETSVEHLLPNTNHSKNTPTDFSDPLMLGKKFKITYASYGCFRHTETSVEVQEQNRQYLVTVKGKGLNNRVKPVLFDSKFKIAIARFSQFYQQVINNQINKHKSDMYTIGTVHRITIEGGLHTINLFCDTEAELSGFHTLVNIINFPL